jgi:hypothetical protein
MNMMGFWYAAVAKAYKINAYYVSVWPRLDKQLT